MLVPQRGISDAPKYVSLHAARGRDQDYGHF